MKRTSMAAELEALFIDLVNIRTDLHKYPERTISGNAGFR